MKFILSAALNFRWSGRTTLLLTVEGPIRRSHFRSSMVQENPTLTL